MANCTETLIRKPMGEIIDPALVSPILSTPPFIQIPSLFNIRDLADGTDAALRKGFVFRSGSLENTCEEGKAGLQNLGIKTIFDLRSEREIKAFPDPEIEGIEVVKAETDTDPLQVSGFASVSEMYMGLLVTHRDIWRKVLEHVRDHPEKSFLVHCTGGKDRTGVAAALILGIAGASPAYISHEYALTRIGIEPVREMLTQKFTGGKPMDLEANPMLKELMRTDPDMMQDFLKEVDRKFGGVEGYVLQKLGFSEDDLAIMRTNLKRP